MSEKGILMSTPMVIALIYEKSKSHTRRTAGLEKVNEHPDEWEFIDNGREDIFTFFNERLYKELRVNQFIDCVPRYLKGDVLWLRETHYTSPDKKTFLGYVADGDIPHGKPYIVRPSLFMFKEFSHPNRYEVISVRPHRVQSITDGEALLEGFKNDGVHTARENFAATIEKLNPKDKPWSRNLFVWNYGLKEL